MKDVVLLDRQARPHTAPTPSHGRGAHIRAGNKAAAAGIHARAVLLEVLAVGAVGARASALASATVGRASHLAVGSIKTGRASAGVRVDLLQASAAVLTWAGGALEHVQLAVLAGEAADAGARVVIEQVGARGTVAARVGAAVIDILGTGGPRVTCRALARERIDAVDAHSVVQARAAGALVNLNAAKLTSPARVALAGALGGAGTNALAARLAGVDGLAGRPEQGQGQVAAVGQLVASRARGTAEALAGKLALTQRRTRATKGAG